MYWIQPFEALKFCSYLTVNNFRLHWKGQWINAVEENNRYLLWESDETQKHVVIKKNRVFKCNG
jgi:hypothetical protein